MKNESLGRIRVYTALAYLIACAAAFLVHNFIIKGILPLTEFANVIAKSSFIYLFPMGFVWSIKSNLSKLLSNSALTYRDGVRLKDAIEHRQEKLYHLYILYLLSAIFPWLASVLVDLKIPYAEFAVTFSIFLYCLSLLSCIRIYIVNYDETTFSHSLELLKKKRDEQKELLKELENGDDFSPEMKEKFKKQRTPIDHNQEP
ncbi:hypothetical protein JGK46_001705 [Aeromonas bestiarum]|nr:hypothetical protein [Aeromonas bestiarum]